MHVLTIDVPHLGNRTHLVHDGRVGVVIDPPRDLTAVESAAEEAGVDIVAVAETHIHNDYVSGGLCLSNRHGAEYLVAADEEVEFDRIGVHDNETLAFGDIDLRVIATPGHTPLHVSYLATDAGDADAAGALFSGGSLLHGTVGRTDLVDPTLVHRPGPRPVALGRDGSARCRPTPRCTRPTASAASARARRPTPPTGEVTIADQRDDEHRTDDRAGHLRHAACSRGSGRCPATTPTWRRATGRAPWTPRPATRLDHAAALEALARGAHVVDVRSSADYAAGHLRGTLAIPAGAQCAVYAGWVTPWGADLVFLSDSEATLDALERELASIGIEGVATATLEPTIGRGWTGLRRTDWEGFVADPPAPNAVVLDVRRPEEWRAGHLAGSLNIAVHELPQRLDEVPPGEVWVHCAAGYRATVAAGLLDRAGRDVVLVDDEFAKVGELGIPLLREQPCCLIWAA